MARMIDADVTADAFTEWFTNTYDCRMPRDIVDAIPTVDAVPVVHGRWINTGDSYEDEYCRYNYWECSACGNRIAGRYGLHNYCPNCGSLMDREVER